MNASVPEPPKKNNGCNFLAIKAALLELLRGRTLADDTGSSKSLSTLCFQAVVARALLGDLLLLPTVILHKAGCTRIENNTNRHRTPLIVMVQDVDMRQRLETCRQCLKVERPDSKNLVTNKIAAAHREIFNCAAAGHLASDGINTV
jgi:hypothetical protein